VQLAQRRGADLVGARELADHQLAVGDHLQLLGPELARPAEPEQPASGECRPTFETRPRLTTAPGLLYPPTGHPLRRALSGSLVLPPPARRLGSPARASATKAPFVLPWTQRQGPFGLNCTFSAGKQSASFSAGQPDGTPVDSRPVCVVWAKPRVPSGKPDPRGCTEPSPARAPGAGPRGFPDPAPSRLAKAPRS
jgi:hypothetical protein